MPTIDTTEAVLMIDPPPPLAMTGMAYLQPKKTPLILTAMRSFQAASSVSTTDPVKPYPALLTSTSMRPKRWTVSSIMALVLALLATSTAMLTAPFPAEAATVAAASAALSATTTVAPSRAKMWHAARPMPDPPPVMMQILPCSLIMPPGVLGPRCAETECGALYRPSAN